MRALLGGKTYLEKAGLLVAHPGAEAQRWHMDTPHPFASRRAAAHPARRPFGCMRSIAAAPHTSDPRPSLRLSMRSTPAMTPAMTPPITPAMTPTRQHLPPHSVSVFIPLCALTASNGPTEFQLSTHIKANLTRPPAHAAARCPLGSVAIYDIDADSWSTGPELPLSAWLARAAALSDGVHVISGEGHWIYRGDAWVEAPCGPVARVRTCACIRLG